MVKTLGLGNVSKSWNPKPHKRLQEFVDEGLKVEIGEILTPVQQT